MKDCLIVGGGPAGLTAALYLRRFHRTVDLIDAGDSRARLIPRSHNFPGFADGISGVDLLATMRRQLTQVDGEVMSGTVSKVERRDDGIQMILRSGAALAGRALILCTGVKDIEPNIDGVDEVRLAGRLRQCPVCDAYEYTRKPIAILGDSAHSVNEALFLRDFTPRITFFAVSRGSFTAAMAEELARSDIEVVPGTPSRLSVEADAAVVTMDNGEDHRFEALYSALGVSPRSSLAHQLGCRFDDCDNVVADAHGRTGVEDVYVAGDIVSGLNQLVVSASQAAIAATAVHNRLRAVSRSRVSA